MLPARQGTYILVRRCVKSKLDTGIAADMLHIVMHMYMSTISDKEIAKAFHRQNCFRGTSHLSPHKAQYIMLQYVLCA